MGAYDTINLFSFQFIVVSPYMRCIMVRLR
nr:MAG TPA: hypothetical protein [Caudoviricetes sp.]